MFFFSALLFFFARLISGERVSVVCIYGLFLFAAAHLFLRFIAATIHLKNMIVSVPQVLRSSDHTTPNCQLTLFLFSALKCRKKKKTNYRFHFAKSRIGFSVAAYEPHGARFMRRVASSSVPSFPYSFAAWLTLYFTISILVAVAGTFFFRALNRNENEPVFGCFFFGARKVHLRRFVTAPNELGS